MNMELVMQALEVMWKGMLSIFTVIIILTILVYVLNKILKD
ncbi:MAG TPA: sodium pump decarboxylase gamma subunit [Candidatus Blautia intestinavium]|nr:sodium pump decarboxylase gamma subunit [Candidatus Blautia intestinavium]HJD27355.1 sodium pump decarboxylase gamma subunit [Candidatus Blautia intestinipullorum]